MRDRILVAPTHHSVAFAQLPGRETELVGREATNTQGGIFPAVVLPALLAYVFADEIAELYQYCLDDLP